MDNSNNPVWTREVIDHLVKTNSIIIFGRGNLETAFDGHTKRAVDIFLAYGVVFKLIDITGDEAIWKALVEYSGWSLPQVFINGKLIGGSDSLLELHEKGELSAILRSVKLTNE